MSKYVDLYGLFNYVDYYGNDVERFYNTYLDLDHAKRRAEEVETMDGDEWLEWEERNDGLVLMFKGHIDDGVKVPSKTPYKCFIIKNLGRLIYTDERIRLTHKKEVMEDE